MQEKLDNEGTAEEVYSADVADAADVVISD